MVRGSFSRVSTRCGKSTCWCAESEKGHMHNRITWSHQGRMRTRKVPQEQVDRVKGLTETYRAYKKRRRELATLYQQIIETIIQLESAAEQSTRQSGRHAQGPEPAPPGV